MSRKHNTKHHRSKHNYARRLAARGVSSAAVRMDDLETLRRRASRQATVDDEARWAGEAA